VGCRKSWPRFAVGGIPALAVACAVTTPTAVSSIAGRREVSDNGTAKGSPSSSTPLNAGPAPRHETPCEENTLELLAQIEFPERSAAPFNEGSELLDLFACKLRVDPEVRCRIVAVVGHADPAEGSGDDLARARAERIVAELTRRGVAPECLRAESAGTREPTTDGHSNRRVTLRRFD
jgi:outer membrane protein OmpA-like peptidoglycan-associated protein